MDLFVGGCGVTKFCLVRVRTLVAGLSFLVKTMGKVKLRDDIANLGLTTFLVQLGLFDLVDELVKGFPGSFVLIVCLLVNYSSLNDHLGSAFLKFSAVLFVRWGPRLPDFNACLSEQNSSTFCVCLTSSRVIWTVRDELVKKPQRLIELPRLNIGIGNRSAACHQQQRGSLLVRDDLANLLRHTGVFAQRVKVQQRVVIVASFAQPLEKLNVGLFSMGSGHRESSHRQCNDH